MVPDPFRNDLKLALPGHFRVEHRSEPSPAVRTSCDCCEVVEQPAEDGAAHGGQARGRWRSRRADWHFPPPRPAVLGEAQVLQKSKSDAGHQGVPVQPRPGAPFELAEAELSLELLVHLFARPARLDGGRQRAQRRAGVKLLR